MAVLGNENEALKLDFVNYESSLSPFEFLSLLDNSEFVITDSFHATVFSLIFNKPFYHFLRFPESVILGQNQRVLELLKNSKTEDFLLKNANSEIKGFMDFPLGNIRFMTELIEFSKTQLLINMRI